MCHAFAKTKHWLASSGQGTSPGFSLIDVLIAMGLGIIVLTGALVLTSRAVNLNDLVTQKSDMQQNGRVAVNLMARDLTTAGTGFSPGGIQLPSGTNSTDSLFACEPSECYIVSNAYAQDRLFAVNPGDGKGPDINGSQTDVVTLVYKDETSTFDQAALLSINADGTDIEFDTMTPPYNDPIVGLRIGDIIVLSNSNGSAAAEVTEVRTDSHVLLSENDPLKFNQPNAAFGNVKAILTPAAPTFAHRLHVVTYYLKAYEDSARLMRQVNGQEEVPVAENVEDLQITYDIFDENTTVVTTDLPNAGSVPNQIRKINISVSARSPVKTMDGKTYQRSSLTTSVGPRNLTYRDRYE